MLDRKHHLTTLMGLLSQRPAVVITGPRQAGKTTLARMLAAELDSPSAYYDLEDPADQARLAEPGLVLKGAQGLVVLDEVQQAPRLLAALPGLMERPELAARFLLLASVSPAHLGPSLGALADRVAFHALEGLRLDEVGAAERDRLWLRGGYPAAYLATDEPAAVAWHRVQIRALLQRDLPRLGARLPAADLHRLWVMLAHAHGQTLRVTELGRSLDARDAQVRRHLEALGAALLVRTLPPFQERLSKRQVRAPKVYIQDSGLLHALLGLEDLHALLGHPKAAASWEGFSLGQVTARLRAPPEQCFRWATHAGAELDLLVVREDCRLGFAFQRTADPRTTRAMHVALSDLRLTRLDVVHAGERTFPLGERIRALALARILEDLEPF